MARPPEAEPPESVTLGAFTGLKNTVAEERLQPTELSRAINVDIDDAGQLRRRRGFTQRDNGSWHSLRQIAGKTLGVRNGILHLIRTDFSWTPILEVGTAPVCFTTVNDEIYFANAEDTGVITEADTYRKWGHTDGQGRWLSPVLQPTETLGQVAGKLLGDPLTATSLAAYSGRIYMAVGKVLWATELFFYDYVDRTKNFMQFEHDITMLAAMEDGIYVGTTGGLYFLKGIFGKFKLLQINGDAVLPGSMQEVPQELVHPSARNQPLPAGMAAVFLTDSGIMAGFDGGTTYNLTIGTVEFPRGVRAASLFRQDQGANAYVATVDSAGGPASNARIGDYVDAEIVRRQ